MLKYQIAALLIMAFFYAIYLGKMIAQKRQGIVTNSAYKKHVHRYIGRKSCVFLKVER